MASRPRSQWLLGERIDVAERITFLRELEHIERENLEQPNAELKARQYVPLIGGISPDKHSYTWREFASVGEAKLIADSTEDYPLVNASGKEYTQQIKKYGAAFAYSDDELAESNTLGRSLDRTDAVAAKRAIDEKVDKVLATGDATVGTKGLLNQTTGGGGIALFTLADKSGPSGGKSWGTIVVPNATGEEIANDIIGFVTSLWLDSEELITRVSLIMTGAQYALCAQKKMSTSSDVTVLKYVQTVCPYLAEIGTWNKCKGAGAGGTTDRMVAYSRDSRWIGGIVNQEYRQHEPQRRNQGWRVNADAKCGGVIVRLTQAMKYADGA